MQAGAIKETGNPTPAAAQVLAGGGDLAARMRQIDWSSTPLGPVELWPQSLRTCVRIMLTSRQPMFVWWGTELINLYNDAYCSILGGKHPSALGQPASVVWREIWDQVAPRAATAMKTEEGTYDEALLLIMERNGYPEETYYTFSYSPVPNDQGGTGGIICANTDDTQRILGERQVKTLRELAAMTVNARASQESCELSAQALRGNRRDLPFAMIYLLDADRKHAQLAASTGIRGGQQISPERVSLEAGSDWIFAGTLTTQGGPSVHDVSGFAGLPKGDWPVAPTKAIALPIAGSGQTNQGGILVVGLNPFRILDDSYRGFLELVAGQISSSIANAQAYEEEKKRAAALAELDRAKTAFFSNISHELRTPLTLMLGPIEDELTAGPASGAQRERMELLHRNALRLLKLVNALLDFSRIEAGRVRANYQPLDLSSFTAELASIFRSAVERAGLRLVIDVEPLPRPVFVDREMWEKIVLNLLSNALKSTFEGEIVVKVRSFGSGMELEVRDTGTGIPKDEIPHLFERFRRVEGAKRRTHEGSGIGLALVHELVEMHGGAIAVESLVGIGTAFRVFLPFGSTHLPSDRVQSRKVQEATAISVGAFVQEALTWLPGGGSQEFSTAMDAESLGTQASDQAGPLARVLLVDDNRDMRDYVQRLLSRTFQVNTAVNGRVALEMALADPPDLVLSDVMMPEMDGFQLLAALRENSATKTVPVVLLSARAGEESRIEGLQAGADDYLVKPFTARELIARVDSHIRIARFRKEAHEHEAALVKALHETQRIAAEALEQISDGFWTYDSDLRVMYMNSAAEKISRRPREEQIGKIIFDLFPAISGTEFERHMIASLEQQVPVQFEYFYEPWQRWFAHRVYPTSRGLAVYVRDTTEEKKTEQTLRRAEQLAAAGRLAASISHELNNPLEAVTNLLFLAKSHPSLDGHLRETLEIADKELQRLSHIASKSLKFYRQTTSPSSVQLSEILDSVLFFYEARLRLLNIRVEKDYAPASPVLCFSGEIQQVFTNLISNAIDAMPQGGKLELRVRSSHCNGTSGVRVTIADTGSGISPDTRLNLFQPFYTTKDEGGTGLGLWVSSGIAQKHGATLKVRSRVGEGTVFSMFMPLSHVNSAEAYARSAHNN
jgi:signal transduction histidine kinase